MTEKEDKMKSATQRNLRGMGIMTVAMVMAVHGLNAYGQTTEEQTPEETIDFPAITYGVRIAGGGLGGLNIRGDVGADLSLGISALARPFAALDQFFNVQDAGIGLMVPIDAIYWFSKREGGTKGPQRHGASVIAGYSVSKYSEVMGAVAYEYERYVHRRRMYNASIGFGFSHFLELPGEMPAVSRTSPMLYWAFSWRWK